MYDFPRTRLEGNANIVENEDLNVHVPLPSSRTQNKSKKHSYTNAPPGYFVNKESVFNYDYKPTLPSSADNQGALICVDSDILDRSPSTPNSYTNVMMSTPPTVNRDLKPRRKGSDSDTSCNNLAGAVIKLAPPPALNKIQNSSSSKKSFRKPKYVSKALKMSSLFYLVL